jgi:hypothetical protein
MSHRFDGHFLDSGGEPVARTNVYSVIDSRWNEMIRRSRFCPGKAGSLYSELPSRASAVLQTTGVSKRCEYRKSELSDSTAAVRRSFIVLNWADQVGLSAHPDQVLAAA